MILKTDKRSGQQLKLPKSSCEIKRLARHLGQDTETIRLSLEAGEEIETESSIYCLQETDSVCPVRD